RELSALGLVPLIEGDDLPPYWARRDGDELIVFFAHPATRDVRYPMARGQAGAMEATRRAVRIHAGGRGLAVDLDFGPNQAVLLRIAGGAAIPIAIPCQLADPVRSA